MSDTGTIAVVGAGIAGLATAATLQRTGVDVRVIEQARGLGEVGAGVSLTPNALRVLDGLDLMGPLDRTAVSLDQGMVLYAQDGRRIGGASAVRGGGGRNVHRADLIDTFASALRRGTIDLGRRAVTAIDLGDAVELRFADGGAERFDGVIGADGIHSIVRDGVVASAAPPVFSGMIAYRGLVPTTKLPWWPLDQATMYVGEGRHFLVFPVRGGSLLNFVAFVAADAEMAESWSAPGDPHRLAEEFADWAQPVRDFVAAVDSTFRWGLYDREPLERWTRGRLALAGDAAHAMLPHAGQGANQSIEDAAALGVALAGRGPAEVPAAFAEYDLARRPRGSFVQLFARRLGLEYDSGGSDLVGSGEPLADKSTVNEWIKSHDAGAFARAVRAGERTAPLPVGAPV